LKSIPANAVAYHRTPEFSEATIPPALSSRHSTKRDVWGRICVVRGKLRYRILEPELEEHTLSPHQPGVIEPQVHHEVEPIGAVRFYVEFLRVPR
jgi:tellurite resistance-related uncharacterized protein